MYVKAKRIIMDLIYEPSDCLVLQEMFHSKGKIMKKFLFGLLAVTVCSTSIATVKHIGSKTVNNYVTNAEGMSNSEIIATLRSDIATIDNDIALCEKQRKSWIAATVIGGIGIIGTGVAAIKQANTLSDKKAEYNELKTQVNAATKAADTAN